MNGLAFRRAEKNDIAAIIRLLADDPLGSLREDTSEPIAQCYIDAFSAIDADPHQLLAVATYKKEIIGTLQLSFIPGMSRKGSWRGQIESVRVAKDYRSAGIGKLAFQWAIEQCRQKNCNLVQLTTDKNRHDAHRFYDELGFKASHIGYKKQI